MRFLSFTRLTLSRLHICEKRLISERFPSLVFRKQCASLLSCRFIGNISDQEEIGKLRNIGIIAHIDAGKTTTTERMLYYSGFSEHLGDVDDGDTVMDYMEQEKERGITITSAAISFKWNKFNINLIDTPGHIDFTVEVERCLRVLDGSVTVLDASAGVEAQTMTVWHQADKYSIPSIIYLNKMDKQSASVESCLQSLKEKLNVETALVNFPVTCDRNTMEIIDVIGMQKLTWDLEKCEDGSQFERISLKDENDVELWDMAMHWRSVLISQLAEHSDTIADHILSDTPYEDIPVDDIRKALRKCTLSRQIVPIFCGSSLRNMGIQPLLDGVCLYLPSPRERQFEFTQFYKDSLCALAFKTVHHEQRGVLTFLRLYSGVLKASTEIYNINKHYVEKVGRLLQVYADDFKDIKSAGPGNIVCISGLKQTTSGDTITMSQKTAKEAQKRYKSVNKDSTEDDLVLAGLEVPSPVFFCSVEPPSLSAQKQLEFALECLQREDPSFKVEFNADTGQTILKGMGELHLDIIRQRIQEEYKVDVYLGPLQVAYRETLKAGTSINVEDSLASKFGRQNNFVEMGLQIESSDTNKEFKKVQIVSSPEQPVVANWQHLKAIDMGVGNALSTGPIISYPIVNVQVFVTKFSCKSGTSQAAISACASQCVHKALKQADTELLEPMMMMQRDDLSRYAGDCCRKPTIKNRRYTTPAFQSGNSIGVYSLLKPHSLPSTSAIRLAHSKTAPIDITCMPPPLKRPVDNVLPSGTYTHVFFDLETTSLDITADILELAAVCGRDSFQRYIQPTEPIFPAASKVTGLYIHDGVLYHHSEPCETVTLTQALGEFKDWIKKYKSPMLIAHNGKHFDSVRFAKSLILNPDLQLENHISGFADTLPMFREILGGKQKGFSQTVLATEAKIDCSGAHCAVEDCITLQKLVQHHKVTSEILRKHSFSMQYAVDLYTYRTRTYTQSFDALINTNVLGYSVAEKLSKAGVNFSHLKEAFLLYGSKTFQQICKEYIPKTYGVTLDSPTIHKLTSYFSDKYG